MEHFASIHLKNTTSPMIHGMVECRDIEQARRTGPMRVVDHLCDSGIVFSEGNVKFSVKDKGEMALYHHRKITGHRGVDPRCHLDVKTFKNFTYLLREYSLYGNRTSSCVDLTELEFTPLSIRNELRYLNSTCLPGVPEPYEFMFTSAPDLWVLSLDAMRKESKSCHDTASVMPRCAAINDLSSNNVTSTSKVVSTSDVASTSKFVSTFKVASTSNVAPTSKVASGETTKKKVNVLKKMYNMSRMIFHIFKKTVNIKQ